jgi:hypothetical protein
VPGYFHSVPTGRVESGAPSWGLPDTTRYAGGVFICDLVEEMSDGLIDKPMQSKIFRLHLRSMMLTGENQHTALASIKFQKTF